MSQRRYEVLLLTVPEITLDESKSLEKQLVKLVQDARGSIISFEKWGKYKLVYPVNKNDYGVYYLFRFEIPIGATLIEEMKLLFKVKLSSIVMRSMFSRLPEKVSLAYQRPKSLEETPTRDVETFLKENKMEGLLSSVDSSQVKSKDNQTLVQPTKKDEETKQDEGKK